MKTIKLRQITPAAEQSQAAIHTHRFLGSGFVYCIVLLALATNLCVTPIVQASPPATPGWVGPTEVVSNDGYAELRWETNGSGSVDLFKIQEKAQGPKRESFATGLSQLFYRGAPGVYEFRLKACSKRKVGDIRCGSWSKKLTLTVTGEFDDEKSPTQGTAFPQEPEISTTAAAALNIVGGPDSLQPGLWWNPAKSGHGWSFYWANRLALPSMPSNAYDLYAIFFTYEAKTNYCMQAAGAPGEPCNMNLWLRDYRPVVVEAKLALDNDGKYRGAFTVNQSDGTAPNSGSLEVTFTGNNKDANIDWDAYFALGRHLSDTETIELAFDDGHEVSTPSDMSGHWTQSGSGFQPYIVENIGRNVNGNPPYDVEAVEVVFLDDGNDYIGTQLHILGRAAWIQAGSYPSTVTEGQTDLCFYHVNGYKPTETGQLPVYEDAHCNSGGVNSKRKFAGYATERFGFWVDYTMPGYTSPENYVYVHGGSVSIGTSSNLQELEKASNFHRIWFNGANSCQINSTTPICQIDLTWFTDSDFPQATVYAYNGTTRDPIATSTQPVMENQLIELTEDGTYVFELRMNNSPSSRMIAESSEFTVTVESSGEPPVSPTTPQGQWMIDCSNHNYTISWSHGNDGNVNYYELEESRPGLTTLTHTVSPGTTKNMSFTKSSGPFGTYSYLVRACNTSGC
ncbi:MAG: hypothetical protein WBM36_09670, partial [Lysobacterales bacterium]